MSKVSLGAQMLENKAKAAAAAAEAERIRVEKEDLQARKELATVKSFFAETKKKFIQDITAGNPETYVELRGRGGMDSAYYVMDASSWNDPAKRIDMNKNHKFHKIWLEFESWALSNELVAQWEYTHDGMSESWHVLSVKPLG
jgi:hypothetical protein